MHRYSLWLSGILLFGLLSACSEDDGPSQPPQPVTHDGQSQTLGQGNVTAYERVAADGSLLAVGVRFDESVLAGLPDQDTPMSLMLPKKAASSPFNHVGFDWAPHGHFPAPVYGLPHFDIHFYVVDAQKLSTIEPGPDLVLPEPQYMPKDYVSGVDAVPFMGTHYVDTTAAELHGATFDKTFIYGFYKGELFFMEPMITKAYFETKPNVTVDIKQPAAYQSTGKAYPTKYTVSYDATAKQYTVELNAMKMH
jgi:hypothetical protein